MTSMTGIFSVALTNTRFQPSPSWVRRICLEIVHRCIWTPLSTDDSVLHLLASSCHSIRNYLLQEVGVLGDCCAGCSLTMLTDLDVVQSYLVRLRDAPSLSPVCRPSGSKALVPRCLSFLVAACPTLPLCSPFAVYFRCNALSFQDLLSPQSILALTVPVTDPCLPWRHQSLISYLRLPNHLPFRTMC